MASIFRTKHNFIAWEILTRFLENEPLAFCILISCYIRENRYFIDLNICLYWIFKNNSGILNSNFKRQGIYKVYIVCPWYTYIGFLIDILSSGYSKKWPFFKEITLNFIVTKRMPWSKIGWNWPWVIIVKCKKKQTNGNRQLRWCIYHYMMKILSIKRDI